jgi:hypothetical protein
MKNNRLSARVVAERIILALLFIVVGGVIMIVFKPWGRLFFVAGFGDEMGRIYDYLGRIGVSLLLLVAAGLLRRSKWLEEYWQISFALFILAVAVSMDLIINTYVLDHLGLSDTKLAGWALPKLNECLVVISIVIVFTRVSGGSLGSIYIQKGNLKLGLIIGGILDSLGADHCSSKWRPGRGAVPGIVFAETGTVFREILLKFPDRHCFYRITPGFILYIRPIFLPGSSFPACTGMGLYHAKNR